MCQSVYSTLEILTDRIMITYLALVNRAVTNITVTKITMGGIQFVNSTFERFIDLELESRTVRTEVWQWMFILSSNRDNTIGTTTRNAFFFCYWDHFCNRCFHDFNVILLAFLLGSKRRSTTTSWNVLMFDSYRILLLPTCNGSSSRRDVSRFIFLPTQGACRSWATLAVGTSGTRKFKEGELKQ